MRPNDVDNDDDDDDDKKSKKQSQLTVAHDWNVRAPNNLSFIHYYSVLLNIVINIHDVYRGTFPSFSFAVSKHQRSPSSVHGSEESKC